MVKETGCGVEKRGYCILLFAESLLESRPPIFLSNTRRLLFSVAQRECWSKNGKQTQSVEPWCRQIIHPSCHMIAHQLGRWGCIASSSWNNGCTCLPCHLCLLIVSLSYIGEASASPASDRRAFIWKSHYFQRDCSFCFFSSPLSFFASTSFYFPFPIGRAVVKVKWVLRGYRFHILIRWGDSARLKSSHALVFHQGGAAWQTTLISSSFGAINRHASQSYLQLGGTGRTQTGSHEGVDKRL